MPEVSSAAIESFGAALASRAAETPDRVAFIYLEDGEAQEMRITYGALDRRARAIAAQLAELAAPGERVFLFFPQGVEFVAALFGCFYAGVVAIPATAPLSPRTVSRFQPIARDAKARIALTTTALRARLEALLPEWDDHGRPESLVAVDEPELDAGPGPGRVRSASGSGGDTALIQYTSGSTGDPKGVVVTHANIYANSDAIRRRAAVTTDDVLVSWLPTFHDMGLIGGVLQPVFSGFPCVLMSPAHFIHRPARWLRAITRYRATLSIAPNFAYDQCVARVSEMDRASLDLSSWRVAVIGAEPIRASTIERFADAFHMVGFRRQTFFPTYGLAEATLQVSGGPAGAGPVTKCVDSAALLEDRVVGVAPDAPNARTVVASGRVDVGGHVDVADRVEVVDPERRTLLPPGRVGEIWVSGPSVANGYWNQLHATQEVFGGRLAEGGSGERFLRTGDLGFVSGSELYVVGRFKDLIVIHGANHHPQDIERTAIASHPAVQADGAAAFAVETESSEAVVVAVETRLRDESDRAALGAAVRGAVLAEHAIHVHDVVLLKAGALPRTSSGKVRRRACGLAYRADEWR